MMNTFVVRSWLSNPFVFKIYLKTPVDSEVILSLVRKGVKDSWMKEQYEVSVYRNGFEVCETGNSHNFNKRNGLQTNMGTIYEQKGYSILFIRVYNELTRIVLFLLFSAAFLWFTWDISIHGFMQGGYQQILSSMLFPILFLGGILLLQLFFTRSIKKILKVLLSKLDVEIYNPTHEQIS